MNAFARWVAAGCLLVSALPSPAAEPVKPSFEQGSRVRVGDVSPVLSVQTVDGQTVDFHGKVVVLNFFATWCGPCMMEMPRLEKEVWRPLKGKGLLVIAVGREHSVPEILAFQRQTRHSFLFAADPKREIYGKFAEALIPRCVVIGKDGVIKYQVAAYSPKGFSGLTAAVRSELGK